MIDNKNSEIKNIVYYTFESESGPRTQACIFYEDGVVKNVLPEEAGRLAHRLLRNKQIEGGIKENLNKKYIYKMSGDQLIKYFDILKTTTEVGKEISKLNHSGKKQDEENLEEELEEEPVKKGFLAKIGRGIKKIGMGLFAITGISKLIKFVQSDKSKSKNASKINKKRKKPRVTRASRIKNSKLLNKNKKSKKKGLGKRIAAFATAAILFLTGGAALGSTWQKKQDAKNNQPKTTTESQFDTHNTNISSTVKATDKKENTNYKNFTFTELLEVTQEKSQADTMAKLGNSLDNFNDKFASSYLESGKDIRAALSWDEVSALNIVYNNYSKAEVEKIYNGAELDKVTLSNAFKTANLQLMGAYVIETRNNPVLGADLIDSKEGQEFYNRYHEMFQQAKEATGTDQVNKVNAFFQELYKDFPIDDTKREVGIAHADGREMIESYKFSIIPMVSAAEMMFQNLEIDYTLTDKAIDYLNDIGVCNYADDMIAQVAMDSRYAEENSENPAYVQFKEAKIKELQEKNIYVIDDAHRDLSQLDAFKNKVNVHFEIIDGAFTGETYYSVEESTNTSTQSESTTSYSYETSQEETSDRDYAVNKAGAGAVSEAEAKANEAIDRENAAAKEKAEQEAAEKEKQMQQEADADRKEQEKEVADSERDLNNKLDDANNNINNNNKDNDTSNDTPTNEDDFGDHNVDFDNNHSNDNGDLDDSVKDLTTDGSGSKDESSLPDPNETGNKFDNQGQQSNQPETTAPAENESSQNIYEYEEPVAETAKNTTKESIADQIIEQMARAAENPGKDYQYVIRI